MVWVCGETDEELHSIDDEGSCVADTDAPEEHSEPINLIRLPGYPKRARPGNHALLGMQPLLRFKQRSSFGTVMFSGYEVPRLHSRFQGIYHGTSTDHT